MKIKKCSIFKFKKFSLNLITIIVAIFFMFPIFYVMSTAFKPKIFAFTIPPVWITKPTFENFLNVFTKQGFFLNLTNSIVISLSVTVLSLVVAVPAAYAFSRYKFKGKHNLLFWVLSTRMAPPIAVVVPFFLIINKLGLYDKQIALIILYLSFNIPLAIWILKSFFDGIPREFEEAAMLDGCNFFTAFIKVLLPLSTPGIATTAIFCFIFSWNEFLMAFILTGKASKTLPVLVTGYIQTTRGIIWSEMSAAAVIIIIPTIIFTLFSQRYLLRGLTFGGLRE